MADAWRIFEIDDAGKRSVAGWGDHSSIASAKAAVAAWGKILVWTVDTEFDCADALIIPANGLACIQLAVEKIPGGVDRFPTN